MMTWGTALLAVGLLVTPTVGASTDVPTPLDDQLARSVESYSTAGTIERYRIDGSVERLVQKSDAGGVQSITVGTDVLFDYASSTLDKRAHGAVTELLKDIPKGAKVAIDGHTDSRGSTASNQALSLARAKAVAGLVASARPDLVLTVHGYGETRPIAQEYHDGKPDYDAMAKDRRVELRVQR